MERTADDKGVILCSTVRFTDFPQGSLLVPAINRWAILSRPLSADWEKDFLSKANPIRFFRGSPVGGAHL